jgi:hypothetical protein
MPKAYCHIYKDLPLGSKFTFSSTSRFLLEKLIVTQRVEKLSLFNGPESTSLQLQDPACHWTL